MKLFSQSALRVIISLVVILSIALPGYAKQAFICPCCLQSFCICSCDEKTNVDRLTPKCNNCTKTDQLSITCDDCSHFNKLNDFTIDSKRKGFAKQFTYANNQSTLTAIEFMVSDHAAVTINDRDLLQQPPKFLLNCSLLI